MVVVTSTSTARINNSTSSGTFTGSNTITMNWTNTTNATEHRDYQEYYEIAPFIVSCLLCGLAIVGNLLLILAICMIPGKRSRTHILIINLAIGDLGESLMFLIDEVVFFNRTDEFICARVAIGAIFKLFDGVSILSLFALAINQHMAICRPLHYPSLVTRSRILITVALIWIISSILPIVAIVGPHVKVFWKKCVDKDDIKNQTEWAFAILLIAEIITIVVLYSKAYCQISSYQARQSQMTQGQSSSSNETNWKALVTTMFVLATLVITWIPYLLYRFIVFVVMRRMIDVDLVTDLHYDVYFYFIAWLPVINTISDPLIYGIRMPEVRKGFRRVWCAKNNSRRSLQRNATTTMTLNTNDKKLSISESSLNQAQIRLATFHANIAKNRPNNARQGGNMSSPDSTPEKPPLPAGLDSQRDTRL